MPPDTVLDAWCKGYATARHHAQAVANPYPEGTRLAEVWARAREKSLDAAVLGLPSPPLQGPSRWGW